LTRDLLRELEDWDGWPEAWNPKPGDNLVGVVRRYDQGQSMYGPVHTVIVEREGLGELVSVWLSSTVLLALFRQHRPKVGERIGVRYLGKHPEKGYRRYVLLVDRPEADPTFAPLGGEAGADDTEREPF
jgi:hypothetical protein